MRRFALAALIFLTLAPSGAAQDGMEMQRCVWRCLAAFGPATAPAYHQCVADQCTQAAPVEAPKPVLNGWGDLTGLMAQSFGLQSVAIPGEGGKYWLPDSVDPQTATAALGFFYWYRVGGGNAMQLSVGYFQRTPAGFRLVYPIGGIFGLTPRDAVFSGNTIELTTTPPRPGEAPCCPTGETRWSFDRSTGLVTKLSGP